LRVDAEIAVPEKVRVNKDNINSDTLGTYAPNGQQSLRLSLRKIYHRVL
jgi:hypothetical protein